MLIAFAIFGISKPLAYKQNGRPDRRRGPCLLPTATHIITPKIKHQILLDSLFSYNSISSALSNTLIYSSTPHPSVYREQGRDLKKEKKNQPCSAIVSRSVRWTQRRGVILHNIKLALVANTPTSLPPFDPSLPVFPFLYLGHKTTEAKKTDIHTSSSRYRPSPSAYPIVPLRKTLPP